MIEGFAREVPEDMMAEALNESHRLIRQVCNLQQELMDKVGVVPQPFEIPPPDSLADRLREEYYSELTAAKAIAGKQARGDAVAALRERAQQELIPDAAAENAIEPVAFESAWYALERRVVRDLLLTGTRPDGRDATTLRPIECAVDVLPRVHGSALFQRGETQALISVTLGTARDEQKVDSLFEEYSKKFMLDYNFPPFSVGEVRPIRGPGRREIGHGALAERSVNPVLPDPEDFPYTIRVISDILESNGSSSMASVCGATLGLMAAGVPISNPVAGISVGLVKEDDRWTLLTDIIGEEDHFGDMDFKIAGTQNGITGIQLDLKIDGISEELIRATLRQAREARIQILRKMLTTIPRPRENTSPWAPRLLRLRIDPEKIGMLIGPGGKTIRAIQEETGVVIEVEDDGTVTIASTDHQSARAAADKVEAVTASVQVGRIYHGRVTSVKDFGAFVEILPGKDGLCHISELSDEYVSNVSDICRVGDLMQVKVIAVDEQDRVKLSRRIALRELKEQGEEGNGEP
jgi:polyribonucleotide nucleotidyltransferase